MNLNKIPHLYEDSYIEPVDGYLLVYAPLSDKGLMVLNPEATFLFNQIDNKKTLQEILEIALKTDPNFNLEDLFTIFDNFLKNEIIYFDQPKSKLALLAKKPAELGVWFHITNQCNFRCTYCYVYKTPFRMEEKIAIKAVKKIVQSAKKHGFKKITFKFAGGEPLLEFPLLLKVVKASRELGSKNKINLDFVVISNGALLTKEVANTLKKENIRAAVSLDGLGEYHDKTRVFSNGMGTFKYVKQGIENLQTAKVPFNVSVTITSKNLENLPDLTMWLLENKIPFAFNFYRENPFVEEQLEGDDKKLVESLKKVYALIAKNPPRHSLINGLLDRVNFKRPHTSTCGMGLNYLVIRHDGKLLSCQMTQDRVIGSIDDPDLIESMWKGNFIEPKGLTVEGKNPCQTCQWRYICCGGCPLLTKAQKGNYSSNSPYCLVYKALIPEVLKIEAKRLIKYGKLCL